MADLISALQIVLYILAGYSAIAILHVPFFWLKVGVVWEERRQWAREVLATKIPIDCDPTGPEWNAHRSANWMAHEFDLDSTTPPARFRINSAIIQSIGWPISDACWLAHWMNGAR